MSALRKVLVVDDDPVVARSFNRVLSEKGYLVITAENAAQALDRLREEEVDLVYTDIRMPGMDGLELAEQVKARRPWTPVVIVTGYGTQANEQRAKAAGVSAFLNKPLSPEMIEQSAAAMLAAPAIAAPLTEPAGEMAVVAVATHGIGRRVKNIALFFTAPFIGLAYAVMLPFVGIAMLVGIAVQAMRDKSKQK